MSFGILAYLRHTAEFLNPPRLLWAVIVTAIGFGSDAGRDLRFCLRIAITVIADCVVITNWHIGDKEPAANLPLLHVYLVLAFFVFVKKPQYIVMLLSQLREPSNLTRFSRYSVANFRSGHATISLQGCRAFQLHDAHLLLDQDVHLRWHRISKCLAQKFPSCHRQPRHHVARNGLNAMSSSIINQQPATPYLKLPRPFDLAERM
jgi:hypothetical protein